MSLEALVNALDGLQNDSGRRQEHNAWLQEFQRSSKAWDIVYEVLESDSFPKALKIFCAQTLRNKVAFDIHQVPRYARMPLKDQILLLLERNVALLNVVGVQLCIALAGFAMQVADWEYPVEELMTRFASVEMVPLLFEFLKVLPEEFSSLSTGMVDPAFRLRRANSLIQNNAPSVLNFMILRADIMAQNGTTQSLFFETLRPWLNEVDLPDIISSPLIDWIIDGISNDEVRSAAIECFVTIISETTEIHEFAVQDAIKVLFPRIIELAARYSPQYESDPELHRDLTRLVSEAAEAWHVLIGRDPENFMPLLQAVSQCVASPGVELETVELTFDFFDKLRTVLGEPLPGSTPPVNQVSREEYVPLFINLFESFIRLLEFPESFNGNLEEEESFRDFRYDIGDMLKICSSIAGHSRILEWCYGRLHLMVTEQRPPRPQPLEAMLFSIRAIARTVPSDENVWLPKIFAVLPKLPFCEGELVQHAALMLFGRYSEWSAQHPEIIESELEYIIKAVWSDFCEVRRAAAHAFLYLCTDASLSMLSYLPQLLQFYGTLSGRVEVESLCKYSDGIGAIISHLPPIKLNEALMAIFAPVVERATALCDSGNSQNGNGLSRPEQEQQVGFDIQGLGSLVAIVNVTDSLGGSGIKGAGSHAHPLIKIIGAHHKLFLKLYVEFGVTNDIILESISRFYIRALFNVGAALTEYMPELFAAVRICSDSKPMSPILFELSGAIIQCYNFRKNISQELVQEVWEFSAGMCQALFSQSTLDLLKLEGGIVDRLTTVSSVIYHSFHMLCDLAVYFPSQFFASVFESAVLLSVEVFTHSWDTEALISACHLFDDIESFTPQYGKEPDSDIRVIIAKMIEKHGYMIVHSLFFLFLLKPDEYFENLAERLIDFAFRLAPVASVSWVHQLLMTLPPGTVSDEEKVSFAQRVFQLTSAGNRGIGQELNEFVKAYVARNISPR